MTAEVFAQIRPSYAMRVARDGQVMLRLESLEAVSPAAGQMRSMEETMALWGQYLDHLNALHLLLDSAMFSRHNYDLLSLYEITSHNTLVVDYDNGSVGSSSRPGSHSAEFQRDRLAITFNAAENADLATDFRFASRQVVPIDVFQWAAQAFDQAMNAEGLIKILAGMAKSVCEFRLGNFSTSMVLAWFIIESSVGELWQQQLDAFNAPLNAIDPSLSPSRMKRFKRYQPVYQKLSLLELWGILSPAEYERLDAARDLRNKIIHPQGVTPQIADAQEFIELARTMLRRVWRIDVPPNLCLSTMGL